jgi:hypothetical protein
MTLLRDDPEPLGTDPLDSSMGLTPRATAARGSWFRRTRLALGLSPTPVPALLLVAGLAIGPFGLGFFSATVLSYLDLVVSAALAALGVLVGLGLDMRRPHEWRLLGAATAEAGLTILLVGAGVLLASRVDPIEGIRPWTLALLLGICASASATVPASDFTTHRLVTRVGDLDDVLPIVLGGLALGLAHEISGGAAAWLTIQAIAIALAVAIGGWMLVTQSTSDSEQRVFTVGTVLLLGGVAEFLSGSALLSGLVAGAFWGMAGGDARDRIARDVQHMQHPLVVLLLLMAGARAGSSVALLTMAIVYLLLRVVGKLAGGWLVRRIVGAELPAGFGLQLLSPGVIAVAFALNAELVAAGPAGSILSIAVAASIGSDILAMLALRSGRSE